MYVKKYLLLICAFFLFSFGELSAAKERECNTSFYTIDCFVARETSLLDAHKVKLERIADRVKGMNEDDGTYYPIDQITVVGHSALFNANDPNQEKALERAKNVMVYLNKALGTRDLGSVKVKMGGVSTREPVTTNATTQGRNINRRVEVFTRSKKVFRMKFKSMKRYAKKAYRKQKIYVYKEKTCHSNNDARKICLDNMGSNGIYELVGAVCMPLNIRCIMGKEKK